MELYKVMIIDDEAIIRAGLRCSVNWGELGFEIVEEARNGIEAIEKLSHNPVDLVITDIRMPKMNGIELLRAIKGKDYCKCTIILSGYSEFKYAQQGLSLGVFDYILKPMDPDIIIEVLKNACQFLMNKRDEEEKNTSLKRKLELNEMISREKIVRDMLLGRELPFQSISEVINEYRINLDMNSVQVAVLEIDDFDLNAEDWIKNGSDIDLFEKVKVISYDIINKEGNLKCMHVEGDIGSLGIVLQPASITDLSIFDNTTIDVINRILLGINNELGFQVTIGVGRVYENLSEISMSYMDARNALRHKYLLGSNRIIHAGRIDSSEGRDFLNLIEKEKLLTSYIILGDDSAYRIVEEIFKSLCSSYEGDIYKVSTALKQITSGMAGTIKSEYSYLYTIFDAEMLRDIDFIHFTEIGTVRQRFQFIVKELLDLVREYKLNQGDKIISKACELVLSNVEKEITLKSVSESLGISKNYFCSLFKQETGENFLEYVTRVKMERAKKLLKDGTFKAYEVSYMLGYQETGYFSRLFKKYSGFSPIEFRKNVK